MTAAGTDRLPAFFFAPEEGGRLLDRQTYSLWLVGATAMLVDDRTTPQQRQDVFDSVLYAQLRSDKTSDTRLSNYPAWNDTFREALVARAWAPIHRAGRYLLKGELAGQLPLQWLADQLRAQCPELSEALVDGVMQQALDLVVHDFQDLAGRYAVYHVGALRPGRQLLLCGLRIEHQPSPAPALRPVAEPLADKLPGNDYFSTWQGEMDEESYEVMRDAVHREIAQKHPVEELIKNLGVLPNGGRNGKE